MGVPCNYMLVYTVRDSRDNTPRSGLYMANADNPKQYNSFHDANEDGKELLTFMLRMGITGAFRVVKVVNE